MTLSVFVLLILFTLCVCSFAQAVSQRSLKWVILSIFGCLVWGMLLVGELASP